MQLAQQQSSLILLSSEKMTTCQETLGLPDRTIAVEFELLARGHAADDHGLSLGEMLEALHGGFDHGLRSPLDFVCFDRHGLALQHEDEREDRADDQHEHEELSEDLAFL